MPQMMLRRPTPIELPPTADLEEFFAWSLTNDEPQIVGDLLLLPDVLVVEWEANGTVLPDTVRSVRTTDGRSVSVFAIVGNLGFGIRPVEEGS